MKTFLDYFNDNDIIFYLCRLRAKYAKQKNKKHLIHLLTNDDKYNYHKNDNIQLLKHEQDFQSSLNKLFPSRRKWMDLNRSSRFKKGSSQRLNSIDKNIYSLMNTIKIYQKKEPDSEFIINLNSFITDVKRSIQSPDFKISSPYIYPKAKNKKKLIELKEDEKNICRPISIFNLKDRLILSFTNKYFTDLFDPYFENCSLAFRSGKHRDDANQIINHHSAIKEIVKYKNKFNEIPLWVAECDMKKFYDTVNHKIIYEKFDVLNNKVLSENKEVDLSIPQNIFNKYLECYCFNYNVIKYNSDADYWKKHEIERGEFGWVNLDLKELEYYKDIKDERIGIPQGGALSGLIANIVLDYVDKKVIKVPELFYIRFCDDMIMMHSNKDVCENGINDFRSGLNDLNLVPHEFTKDLTCERKKPCKFLPKLSLVPFWKSKSKGPFKWDDIKNDGFPWIGFVGYEIHYKGYVRVRKSSLENELRKQKEVINRISRAIRYGKRKSKGYIAESAIHRLIGMSVGRVELWNYKDIDNEMCWVNGFKELNLNQYSIKQLKQLDRSRSKLYYRFLKTLNDLSEDDQFVKKTKIKQIIGYNKPFSYYYQGLKEK